MPQPYVYEIDVAAASLDANGHVNNVEFVRWMQDAAIEHADTTGGTAATRQMGGSWVARSTFIEYRKPAFAGDRLRLMTWLANFRRVFSLRKYKFVRISDGALIAEAETDWVFVDAQTGRPRSVPLEVQAQFELVTDADVP